MDCRAGRAQPRSAGRDRPGSRIRRHLFIGYGECSSFEQHVRETVCVSRIELQNERGKRHLVAPLLGSVSLLLLGKLLLEVVYVDSSSDDAVVEQKLLVERNIGLDSFDHHLGQGDAHAA